MEEQKYWSMDCVSKWRDYVYQAVYLANETENNDNAEGAGGGGNNDDWKIKFNFAYFQRNNFRPASI